jgi:hypothetical protein
VAVVLRPKTPSARTVGTSMSVNEVTINSPQTDLLSPRESCSVLLCPVCWSMQTLEVDPSFREIDKVFGWRAPVRVREFFRFVTGTFLRATYLTYTTTQDGPSLPAKDAPLARMSPSGAWVVY